MQPDATPDEPFVPETPAHVADPYDHVRALNAQGKVSLDRAALLEHLYRHTPQRIDRTRISAADCEAIARRYVHGGIRQQDLADEYGIRQQTVSKIVGRYLEGQEAA